MLHKVALLAIALTWTSVAHAQARPPLTSASGSPAVSITANGNGTHTVRYGDGSQFTAVGMTAADVSLFRRLARLRPTPGFQSENDDVDVDIDSDSELE